MLILELNTNGILRDKEKVIPQLDNFYIGGFQRLATNSTGDDFFRNASFC